MSRIAAQGPQYGWPGCILHGGEVGIPQELAKGAVSSCSKLVYFGVSCVYYEVVAFVELGKGIISVKVSAGKIMWIVEFHRIIQVSWHCTAFKHFSEKSHIIGSGSCWIVRAQEKDSSCEVRWNR